MAASGALRRFGVLLALGLLAALGGCGTDDEWDPAAQFAPSLRPAFGARVAGGELAIWTGSPCVGVTRLALVFDLMEPNSAETVLRGAAGTTVERFVVGTTPAGMRVETPLPSGFDWSASKSLTLSVSGPPASWGGPVDLDEVRDHSSEHDDQTYYFEQIGWLDPAQVAAADGTEFLATCTPDPGRG